MDEVDQTVQEQGYDAAFQKAIGRIQEYPTCDRLIYSAILYLGGRLRFTMYLQLRNTRKYMKHFTSV